MQICLVASEYWLPPYPPLGVGQFIDTYARALVEAGHRVQIAGVGGQDLAVERDGMSIRWSRLSRPRSVGWFRDRLELCRWLGREARAGRCDIVEVPDYKGFLPFRLRALPVVVRLHLAETAHARHLGDRAPLTRQWCETEMLRRHRDWLGVSKFSVDVTKRTFRVSPRRLAIVGCPLEVPEPAPPRHVLPPRFLLMAGSISRRKGALVLARAMRQVLAEEPGLHLVLAGPDMRDQCGSMVDQMRQAIGSAAASRVLHVGHVPRDELMGVMRLAVATVSPSMMETFGFVAAESLLQGTPVIATDSGGVHEVIRDGQTGMLVAPGEPVALAAAILRTLRNPGWASELAAAGRERVASKFTPKRCVEESVAFYEERILERVRHDRLRRSYPPPA